MRPFVRLEALAAPLPLTNIDTDKILPARFLKTITREGLGRGLFFGMRDDPGFILNRQPWRDAAEILVTLDNFGCGSSREHAPWALLDFGFRCLIAPSFADIFYNNCFKNGILPITLPHAIVDRLLVLAADPEIAELVVDLPAQRVTMHDGTWANFSIDSKRKNDLLIGLDEIGRTLEMRSQIETFEEDLSQSAPWLAGGTGDLGVVLG